MVTTVVNKHREEFDVYIGRGSKWGNPFRIGHDGDREAVITKYTEYLRKSDLHLHIHELYDKKLGCFCKPLPCHGDVLAMTANIRQRQDLGNIGPDIWF